MNAPRPARPSRERGAVVAPLLAVLAVVAAAYVAAAVWAGDRVPAGTTVGGVAVGGMSGEEARRAVEEAVARQTSRPVTVTAGATSFTLSPKAAGLAVDPAASVEGLTGFSLDPVHLWRTVSGQGVAHQLVTAHADTATVTAAVAKAGASANVPVKEGTLGFAAGKVAYAAPVVGQRLDAAGTADRISREWPGSTTIEAVVTRVQPRTPAAAFEAVKRDFADRVVAGPVTVASGPYRFDVPVTALVPAVRITPADGRVTTSVDPAKVVATVRAVARARGVEKPATDAVVLWAQHGPVVQPSRTGLALRADAIARTVPAAMTSQARLAEIPLVTTQPRLTTEKARAGLPKGLISSFTTHFPDNPVRTTNLRIAAARLDGAYVPQGATFSLNARLGQRTPEKGYQKAQVIYDGRLTYDYGGGISQVSTTMFNAAFFAGVRFDEYLPHSFYISRYPVGREATISWPDVDNRWTNTTDGGILIKAWLSGQDITVQFYGVKTWDVESVTGPRRNVVEPRKVVDDGDQCVPQAPSEGFDITVTRVFKKNGAVVRTQDFNTHYIPEDEVVCTKPWDPNKA